MNHQLEHLQALNSLLADYAESLTSATANAPLTPQSRQALRQAYDLQSRVARRIHGLLEVEAPHTAAPRPDALLQADPALRGFKDAVRQTKRQRYQDIEKIFGDRSFSDGVDRLLTILGPNEFPDDPPAPPSKPQGRSG